MVIRKSDLFDELRIIAKDGGRLSTDDRAKIAQAADDYEAMARALIATQAALIEANNHRIAMQESMLEARRKQTREKPTSMGFSFRSPLNWVVP